jgi:hypothetical protein
MPTNISPAAADQLHAEALAARIIAVRLWGYLSLLQPDAKSFLDKQMNECFQSVDVTSVEGRDAESIKKMAKASIKSAFAGLIFGPPPGSRRQ